MGAKLDGVTIIGVSAAGVWAATVVAPLHCSIGCGGAISGVAKAPCCDDRQKVFSGDYVIIDDEDSHLLTSLIHLMLCHAAQFHLPRLE